MGVPTGCFKRALRDSKKTDLLRKIYGIKQDKTFTWTQIRAALPEGTLPRIPPPSLIHEGMIIEEPATEDVSQSQTKTWRISKEYIGWLRESENGIPA